MSNFDISIVYLTLLDKTSRNISQNDGNIIMAKVLNDNIYFCTEFQLNCSWCNS